MFEESQQIGSIFLLATCISFPVKIPNMAKNVAILISYYIMAMIKRQERKKQYSTDDYAF